MQVAVVDDIGVVDGTNDERWRWMECAVSELAG